MLEKSTLQNHSQFILAVLQQRHKEGLIKTPTTFRVPPRVTLTDQKREQYLRDLANPSQSLRRLARGVPHGIKEDDIFWNKYVVKTFLSIARYGLFELSVLMNFVRLNERDLQRVLRRVLRVNGLLIGLDRLLRFWKILLRSVGRRRKLKINSVGDYE